MISRLETKLKWTNFKVQSPMWIHINNLLAVSITILCLRLLYNSQKR